MNEIVKNEYTEIQKYFDNYYKEQLEVYEEKKYFAKIKAEMLYYVRYNLNYSIREDMLIFDKYGMVIGPDLSTNENKRVFSEAERKLEQKNE